MSYAPSQGRYKVYLIDEVHMLTTHSFNALLKTLEEPQSTLCFCWQRQTPKIVTNGTVTMFTVSPSRFEPDLVESHLEHVLTEEQITYENDALWHLAKAGRGSVRDAMTLIKRSHMDRSLSPW